MSDSTFDIPQPLLQALSKALIAKLSPAALQKIVPTTPSDVPPQKEAPAFKSVVNEIFAQLLRSNVAAQASPRTPRTPRIATHQASPRTPGSNTVELTPEYIRISDVRTPTSGVVNLAGAPLSRTSSNCSSASGLSRTSSNCSSASTLSRTSSNCSSVSFNNDVEEQQDDEVVFIKKRKSSSAQDLADGKVVTVPILSHFDANWLARNPKDEDNPMFQFRVRSGVGYGSQPPKKKYADLVVPFFRRNSRAIIRRLVTANLRDEQQQDPSITYEELRKRYEASALKVVRKRRANHVQSWRSDRRGTHCPLIYGGVSPVSTNDKSRVNNVEAKQRAEATANAEPKQGDGATTNAEPKQRPEASENAEPKQRPGATTNAEPKQRATAGVSFLNPPDEKSLTCKECGEQLTALYAYPKERWGSACDDVWCSECWRKEQNKMVVAHIRDVQKRKSKLKELQNKNNAEDGATPPPRKRQRQKNKNGKTCKWCGSTTHSRRTSLQCPHNKKNQNREKEVEKTPDEVENTPDEGEETPDEGEETPAEGEIREDEIYHALGSGDESDPEDNTPPTDESPRFREGDNVMVTFGKKVFLAQLFKIQGTKYHVYYVGNGEADVVSARHLSTDRSKTRTRAEYINAEFYCDGLPADPEKGLDPIKPGRWKVRRIVDNEFLCVRLSGGGSLNLENFDISYVMGEVRKEEEYIRERGPFCKGRH